MRPTTPDVWTRSTDLNFTKSSELRMTPEVFTTDTSGLRLLHPSPGCILTIRDENGTSVSFRIDGGNMCAEVAEYIRSCGEMPDEDKRV